jgi:hypothetical protein
MSCQVESVEKCKEAMITLAKMYESKKIELDELYTQRDLILKNFKAPRSCNRRSSPEVEECRGNKCLACSMQAAAVANCRVAPTG